MIYTIVGEVISVSEAIDKAWTWIGVQKPDDKWMRAHFRVPVELTPQFPLGRTVKFTAEVE